MAAKQNHKIDAGATYPIILIWKDPDGNAIDLTNYVFRMQVRSALDAPAPPKVSLTNGNGIETPVGTDGKVYITLSAVQTDSLRVGEWFYDVEGENPSGEVTRLVQGRISVDPSVTRDD